MTSGKYLDDLSVGDTFETDGAMLTEGGIIDFALVYDPQAFPHGQSGGYGVDFR